MLQRLQAENGREIFTGKVLGTFNFGGILRPILDVSQNSDAIVLERNATPPPRGG